MSFSLCFLWFARVKPCASFVPWARLLRFVTNWVCSTRSIVQTDRRTAAARRTATIRLPEVQRLNRMQPQQCSRPVIDTCLKNLFDYPTMLGSVLTPGFASVFWLQRIQGIKEQKIAFPVAGLHVEQHKARKTRKRLMKWGWQKLHVNLPKQTLFGYPVTLLSGSGTNVTLKTNCTEIRNPYKCASRRWCQVWE